ncbi:hypothetical protein [Salinispira pacifica]|uniref:Outer membrane protein beta-barrel domain-containing protein n=1 Tax=Salinispira pacifica TaxID=1307761 RepID=V5WL99_9SPIO|nr:hypothetical protein [Salinispira pacifica]AHC16597.1 hypothetical protein L21SP2_3257 [Salinispira pacifica]
MKKTAVAVIAILAIVSGISAQEAVFTDGSNTYISTQGHEMNAYDYLINPAYSEMFQGRTLFFALDNSGTQFGAPQGIEALRAGWAVNDGLGFMFDYETLSDADTAKEEGNTELDYGTYDQVTGQYATITESVNQFLKNNRNRHNLLFHSLLALDGGLGLAFQLHFALDSYSTHQLEYTNTYTDTADVSEASLDTKGDRTETLNSLLNSNGTNRIALDTELGLNTGSLRSRIALGIALDNLRLNSSYTETVTDFDAVAGIDETIRDSETIESREGAYYTTNGDNENASIGMNFNDPTALTALYAGIGSETELPLGELSLIIPFTFGMEIPLGAESVATSTTVTYDDAAADNPETGRTSTIITTSLDSALYLDFMAGAGLEKEYNPADGVRVILSPTLTGAFGISNDVRSRTEAVQTQVDANSDGDYEDAGTDTDTTYTESGYEYQRKNYETTIALDIPLSASWEANELLTFQAGYSMGVEFIIDALNTLITGDAGYIYEAFSDNLEDANSYAQRTKDGSSSQSTPDSSTSFDFGFTSGGSFGVQLNISENFMVDLKATGTQVEFDAFTVMGIMKY